MKEHNRFVLLFLLGSLLSCISTGALAIEIVKNHQPRTSIVIDSNASPQVQRAAKTLQIYIERSTGANLPITNTSDLQSSIYVGNSRYVEDQHFDLKDLDQDGFVLEGDAKHFTIMGGSDWGTEFGVYEFLELYVGVRWLMPTDLGIDVPQHDTLKIPKTSLRIQPTYLSRQMSPVDILSGTPLGQWGRLNRTRGRVEFHHNLLHLFPASKFATTNPEFYPLVNGQRYLPSDDTDWHWQPNLSAPGSVQAATDQIKQYFKIHPEIDSYSLGMNDSHAWDQSAESRKRRNGNKNYLGDEDVSDDYFEWANAVVADVLAQYPDKLFGTLAYSELATPPTKTSVNSHIIPFITYDRMQWYNDALRVSAQQLNLRWEKTSPALGWYDYTYGMSYLLPRIYFHKMQEYLSWGAAHHVRYYYSELYPNWGEGPKPWVLAKLLWNPNQNIDALLDDWYIHTAGARAAPKLKEFYALWETFWADEISSLRFNSHNGIYLNFIAAPTYLLDVPSTTITKADRLMVEAQQLADSPARKSRVAKLRMMWSFYKTSIVTYQSEHAKFDLSINNYKKNMPLVNKSDSAESVTAQRELLLEQFKVDPLFMDTAKYISRYSAMDKK